MEHAGEEGSGCTRLEAAWLSTTAASPCIYPEIERQDATSWNPDHEGPRDAGAVSARSGPRGGNHCGPKLLWVSFATFLRGCDRTVLFHTGKTESAMDTGGQHQELFRPNQPRMAPFPRSYGEGDPSEMVEVGLSGEAVPL